MRKILLLLAAAILLGGCGESAGNGEDGEPTGDYGIYEHQITLKNGDTVTCLAIESGNRGGLSCDWGGTTDAPTDE